MKRRDFIKTSAWGATLPFWLQSCNFSLGGVNYPVFVHSDYNSGHLIMKSATWPKVKQTDTDVAIVGGGIAGLAAAHVLKGQTFSLYELSDRIGGSSSSGILDGVRFSQGAHYDLDYPEYYGEEVLKLLESLDIIHFQSWRRMWTFKDEEHIIPFTRRQQCFENGKNRGDVIPEGAEKDAFLQLVTAFTDRMPLPTRLIEPELHYLNDLTFTSYLEQKLSLSPTLKRQLDYHMMDDYGGTCDQVSALAGIHYFACRPYYREAVNLFSPPQGNDYFVRKLLNPLQKNQIKTQHLVKRIEKSGSGYELEILDLLNKKVVIQHAEQVIYAGQKHALKYIYPDQANIFSHTQAPWMVINMICEQKPEDIGFWQNEYLGENPSFLGFVDSSVQAQQHLKGKRILTGYYCLKPEDRNYLTTVGDNKKRIVAETQGYMEQMLGSSLKVEAAFIQVMGHAMPIPAPGYLFNDANLHPDAAMTYAGVDNGRLPLLFEALDSGMVAGKAIQSLS